MALTSSSLPLRLVIEPIVKLILGGSCFILPSIDEDRLCYVIGDQGLLAFALCSPLDPSQVEELVDLSHLQSHEWPRYSLVMNHNKFLWYLDGVICHVSPTKEEIVAAASSLTKPLARTILDGIMRYYSRQVLEPSIRGFLGILEKQFPRNDLYLFELLQNAVDDGANIVIMKCIDSDQPGLLFCHNGRRFTPLDILGLASVGLSTKGAEDKKKIGFMGVGFKAVYKRYGCVTIFDDIWNLQFREPHHTPHMEPSHSWVLKPYWVDSVSQISDRVLPPNLRKRGVDSWCHFLLQQPRGGIRAIHGDLAHLPLNVPVLLGRQHASLQPPSSESHEWILYWEASKYRVCCLGKVAFPTLQSVPPRISQVGSFGRMVKGFFDQVEIETSINTKVEKRTIHFITASFQPSLEAQEAFELHTKKKWRSQANFTLEDGKQISIEDVSIFFELDARGIPVSSGRTGIIHAILPTRLTMPCSVNLQGSWLLSVDRQDVQNISDNQWNFCLLNQTPRLFLLLLRWISQQTSKINSISSSLKYYYQIFPKINPPDPPHCSNLHIRVMNQVIPMDEMVSAFQFENLIPSRSISVDHVDLEIIQFQSSSKVIWFPPLMMRYLPASLVHDWFDLWPFASYDLDERAWDQLWVRVLKMPTSDLLTKRRNYFYRKDNPLEKTIANSLRSLAAFGAFLELVNSNSQNLSFSQNAAKEVYGTQFPSLDMWPIFLDEDGRGLPSSEIVWLDPEFSSLDEDTLTILRKGAPIAVQFAECEPRNKTQSQVKAFLLHQEFENILKRKSHAELSPEIFRLAEECINNVRTSSPTRIIGIDASCSALLSNFASSCLNSSPRTEDLDIIIRLFQWAMNSSRPKAISFLLVDDLTTLRFVPSNESYSPKLLGNTVKNGLSLRFVSRIYLRDTTISDQLFFSFLEKCGCQTGLSFIAHTRNLTSIEQSKVLGGQLPKLRNSNPSIPFVLPFNLGPLTRKKVEVVDVDLTLEWQDILRKASQNFPLANTIANIICVSFEKADTLLTPTSESTPYLSNLLRGLPQSGELIFNHSNRIPTDFTVYPPPGFARMFFLPPAQPGAEVRSLSPAEWIHRLARTRWVPAAAAGSDVPSLVLRPCEVVLPGLITSALPCDIMPRAHFTETQVRMFGRLSPEILAILAWGTVIPPPPLEDLERISQEDLDVSSETDGSHSFEGISCCPSKYMEIVQIWRRLLVALKENRLTSNDKSRILKVCFPRGNKLSPSIIPGVKNTLISPIRCISSGLPSESDEEFLTQYLCQSGFLLNLKIEELPESWPLIEYLPLLIDLIRPPTTVSINCIGEYLTRSCDRINRENLGHPPSSLQKQIYTYALWIFAKKSMTVSEIESVLSQRYPPEIIERTQNYLKSQFPELVVFCRRGPGLEKSTYPDRWMKIWSDDLQNISVRPILIDDESTKKGCGVLKSSLLKKEHLLQPIGILDHCIHQQSSGPRLLGIEDFLLKVLDIPRISDSNYFSVSAKCAGKPEFLSDATERLGAVLALLQVLAPDHALQTFSLTPQIPPILKYQSLSLLFRYPKFDGKFNGLSESALFPVYALRGGLTVITPLFDGQYSISTGKGEDKSKAIQSLLVAGNAYDYATELDDLVLTLVFGSHRPFIPSIRKALSLLVHLESSQFLKYFDRYFQGLLGNQADEKSLNLGGNQHYYETLAVIIESLRSKQIIDEAEELKKNLGAAESLLTSLSNNSGPIESLPSLPGQGRGVCNLPAWFIHDSKREVSLSQDQLPPVVDSTNLTKRGRELYDDPLLQGPDGKCPRLPGRGRGISNLPAWMSAKSDSETENKRSALDDSVDRYQDVVETTPEFINQTDLRFSHVLTDLFCLAGMTPLPRTTAALISIFSSLPPEYQSKLGSQLRSEFLQEELISALALNNGGSSGAAQTHSFTNLRECIFEDQTRDGELDR